MPDHLHLLAEGLDTSSNLLLFIRSFKRRTSLQFANQSHSPLWQKKFYDHILRPDDHPDSIAWYIWLNPVRATLAQTPQDYPYSGSFTLDLQTITPRSIWLPPWKYIPPM